MRRRLVAAVLVAVGALLRPVAAEEVRVAVASNFAPALERIAASFEHDRGHRVVVSVGSTGKLFAQIAQGAPFDVLLAADAERPARLERDGRAVAGTRFTYARGRLVLWSRDPSLIDPGGEVLRRDDVGPLALANPDTAPYGKAAIQVLERLGLWAHWSRRVVRGEDVGQTYQFVATANAPLGFVALSQLRSTTEGSRWVVPPEWHEPIDQQAVLLERGRANSAAREFLEYLRGPAARRALLEFGYDAAGDAER